MSRRCCPWPPSVSQPFPTRPLAAWRTNPSTGEVWTGITGGNDLVMISDASDAVVGTAATGAYPGDLALANRSGQLFSSDIFASNLTSVDVGTGAIRTHVPVWVVDGCLPTTG